MILFISTSETNLIHIQLLKNGQVVKEVQHQEDYKQSELLLSLIDKLVKSVKFIKSVKSIAVVSGPGAFSALRLGITTANSIAWALKIPLIEIKKGCQEKMVQSIFNKLEKKDFVKQVVPKYGKEPNITQAADSGQVYSTGLD